MVWAFFVPPNLSVGKIDWLGKAQRVMRSSLAWKAGLVLPCKMAVYPDDGKTKIGLYVPTKMLPREMERHQELLKLAEEAEGSLQKVTDGLPE